MKVIGCKSTTSQGDHDVTNFCLLLRKSLLHYQDKIHIYKFVFKTCERWFLLNEYMLESMDKELLFFFFIFFYRRNTFIISISQGH